MTEAKKLPRNPSFTPCPGLRADLERCRDSQGVTGRLNQIWDRYAALIQRDALPLTEDEKLLLSQSMMGSLVEPLLIRHLDQEIQDTAEYEQGDAVARSLVDKLQAATYGQKLATLEKLGF